MKYWVDYIPGVFYLDLINPLMSQNTVYIEAKLELFDVFVECEWLPVNKVRAQAPDLSAFDEMY